MPSVDLNKTLKKLDLDSRLLCNKSCTGTGMFTCIGRFSTNGYTCFPSEFSVRVVGGLRCQQHTFATF